MAKRPGSRSTASLRKQPAESKAAAAPVRPNPAQAPPPLQIAPAPEAVALFQRGMEAMQRHAYADAVRSFQAVLMGFPAERALIERTRLYFALCERELNKRPVTPRTVEERLTAATAALNNGQDEDAAELVRSVLGDDPKHDLALYLLAAVHARKGDREEALSLLGKVIAITPEASAQARSDADFDALHDLEAFWSLTEPPAPPPGPRRGGRRARGER